MDKDKHNTQNLLSHDAQQSKPTLPDFDTLRDMAKNNPKELEQLRIALCQKVIDEAPAHAKHRLEGLMFHINARRELTNNALEAAADISKMMNDSLARMQAMLKDLRTVQSESILLSARNHNKKQTIHRKAIVLPFRHA